ncbi:phosphatase PAP2 family protein [Candidimonas sp. SYP-B2681]|uniref:phosphatase PAP2 family protein n=1 Tax=Candidimonas sp. SYP-B2681 TaxID=2497686 RepID=UPI000F871E21|nr:phosphatase PAP2 family protein [Candidimonas sp. SYP-B2681]RTZ48007.1 phosphatase PAP2 family protein [Candidimonas sp. SYP-B2681]
MRLKGLNGAIKTGFNWLRRRELKVLIGVAAISAAIWIFLSIADEVFENDTRAIDEMILLLLRNPNDYSDPLGPGWLEEMGRDFTALGSVGVLSILTLGICVYLFLINRARAALFTLAAIATGWLVSNLLKLAYDRPRPDLFPHESILYTASFPSGHAMMSAVTYLTLAALLTRAVASWRLRSFFLIYALFLTILVGASRVYLGVHWPTDVVAGWTMGAAWAGLCWLTERWLQQRGIVEPAPLMDESSR